MGSDRKFLVINPNSSARMTEDIRKTVDTADISADVICMEKSPEVLETFADYTVAGCNMLRYIENNDPFLKKYSGVLIACYGDPGLYPLKERLDIPVIGIAEASMSMALLSSHKFSIIAAVPKAKAMMENMVSQYGLNGRLASVEALDCPILEFMKAPEKLVSAVEESLERAFLHGAETAIYGCAGMTMLRDMNFSHRVSILDPVSAGLYQLEALVKSGINMSRAGLYQKEVM
jgi:allantoin racemase